MLKNFFFFKKNQIFIKQNIFIVFYFIKIFKKLYINISKTNIFFFEKYTIEFFFFYFFKKFF